MRQELSKPLRGWPLALLLTYSAAILIGITTIELLRPRWVLPALLSLILIPLVAFGLLAAIAFGLIGLSRLQRWYLIRRFQSLEQRFRS